MTSSVALAGVPVRRTGYGVMQLAEGSVPADDAVALLRRAADLGVNHFDTADFYGDGVANDLLRRAIGPFPGSTVVATKVGAVRRGDRLVTAQRPEELRRQVEANLTRLGVERIPVVNLRRCDTPPGLVAVGDQIVPIDDQLAELDSLRDQGKIGGIGLSSVTTDQVRAAEPVGIACVQNWFNLLNRRDRPTLEFCRDEGIPYVPYCPLGSSFPGWPKVAEHPEVVAVAGELGRTPAQVGLAWLRACSPTLLLIAGTRSEAHLVENVAAEEITLDGGRLRRLDAVAA